MKKIFGVMVTGCLLALMIAVPAHAQLPGIPLTALVRFEASEELEASEGFEVLAEEGLEPVGFIIINDDV